MRIEFANVRFLLHPSPMKLAEALALRSDLQKKIESLRKRIANNAVVQEGSTPHEDPDKLLKSAFGTMKELRTLVVKINAANAANTLPDGRTITEAIADRDELGQRHAMLQTAVSNSHKEPDRYAVAEIRWVACYDVKTLQKQLEDTAKKIRELNLLIQETNWQIDL